MKTCLASVLTTVLLGASLCLTVGCRTTDSDSGVESAKPTTPAANGVPKFADILKISKARCVSCHEEHDAMKTYAGIMEMVRPGKPDDSSFYTDMHEDSGITDAELAQIKVWILAGANQKP